MEIKSPVQIDYTDIQPKQQKSGEVTKYRHDYRVVAVIFLFLIVLLFVFFLLHQWAVYLITYEVGYWVWVGIALLTGMYLPAIVSLSIFVGIGAYWLWNKARKAGLVNALEHQLTVKTLATQNYAKDIFEVARARADKSIYQGVSTLTLDKSKHISTTGITKEEDDLIEESKEDTETLPLFSALQSENLILRSGQSLLIGFHKEEEKE